MFSCTLFKIWSRVKYISKLTFFCVRFILFFHEHSLLCVPLVCFLRCFCLFMLMPHSARVISRLVIFLCVVILGIKFNSVLCSRVCYQQIALVTMCNCKWSSLRWFQFRFMFFFLSRLNSIELGVCWLNFSIVRIEINCAERFQSILVEHIRLFSLFHTKNKKSEIRFTE